MIIDEYNGINIKNYEIEDINIVEDSVYIYLHTPILKETQELLETFNRRIQTYYTYFIINNNTKVGVRNEH